MNLENKRNNSYRELKPTNQPPLQKKDTQKKTRIKQFFLFNFKIPEFQSSSELSFSFLFFSLLKNQLIILFFCYNSFIDRNEFQYNNNETIHKQTTTTTEK